MCHGKIKSRVGKGESGCRGSSRFAVLKRESEGGLADELSFAQRLKNRESTMRVSGEKSISGSVQSWCKGPGAGCARCV